MCSTCCNIFLSLVFSHISSLGKKDGPRVLSRSASWVEVSIVVDSDWGVGAAVVVLISMLLWPGTA